MNHEPLPWLPIAPGFELKLLRGETDRDARALLLRLQPGTVVPRHRHGGEVHAYNLAGRRELDTGEVIEAGGYVYEPPGNVDSWRAIGEEPVLVYVVMHGPFDYLDDADRVTSRTTTSSLAARYRAALEGGCSSS